MDMSRISNFKDYAELMVAAKKALDQALEDGEKKGYGPGHWKTVDIEEHLSHGFDHAEYAKYGVIGMPTDIRKAHIKHGICRLLMAYALIGEEKECT